MSAHIPKLFYQRILCDALALAFQEIQTVLRSDQVTSGDSEKINRQLHEIEGVFNFMQQPGLAGLLAMIREVFQKYPNQKNHTPPLQLIDEVFAKLLFFLGEVSLGQKVMAYQLLPVWQQLRPYLSDNSITPACLLSLDLLDVSHVETILNLITANTSEVIASTEDVEQALLDLLRAEVQTENLSRAAEIIFNAITEIYLRHPQLSQRCYWAVARRFVELMIRNLAVNLPRSKKILSSVVRAIRQRSEIMWPALPDSLVKEILYQLAETGVDGDGQTVNAWFQIDAQLSGLSIPWAELPDARDLIALLNKIDALIALIPLPNTSQWNDELNEISNFLERIPFFVEAKKLFFESINPWLGKDDLTVITYLMGLKECVAIALKDRHLQSAAERAIRLIKEIQLCKSSDTIASQSQHDHLSKIAFYTLQPSSVVAIKTTLLSWLTENELQLDPLLTMRDNHAIAELIQRVLPTVRAALLLLGDIDGVIKVESLARFGNVQQSHEPEGAVIDVSELVEQWAGLCLHIDSKLSNLAEVCNIPSYLATVNQSVAGLITEPSNGLAQVDTTLNITSNTALNTTLKDIFMLEAKDRLSVLRFLVTQFSLSESELLPSHAAIEALGKPRQGLVFIKLSEQGAELRLQVIDDGRGLNFVRIREQAIARGLLSANAEPDSDSLTQLIFESGFSTAEQVTGLAGRGIGMDAVKATIIAMGGAIKVESQSGLGTSVIMALPKSSSTQKILLVSDAHQKIALPSAMVQQVLSMSSASANQVITEGFIQWQDKKIALFALSDLIREPTVTHSATDRISFLILRQLDDWIAVKVGEVHGHHEVVVKPPGPQLASVPGLMGAAMLPDGDILLVMNLLQLHAHAVSNPIARSISAAIVPEHVPPLVMVVDDSLTVRRVSQRMLEKHGYGVALARHGAHALELLSQLNPAAVLLDIEMPTMDGFELLSRLRSDERFRKLPVAMITSRMAERHRQHAMQLGANAYFGKPYREQELLEWLAQCAPVQNLRTAGNRTDHNQTLTSTA